MIVEVQHRMPAQDFDAAADKERKKDNIERVRDANADWKAKVEEMCRLHQVVSARSVTHQRSSIPGRTQMTYAARTGPYTRQYHAIPFHSCVARSRRPVNAGAIAGIPRGNPLPIRLCRTTHRKEAPGTAAHSAET